MRWGLLVGLEGGLDDLALGYLEAPVARDVANMDAMYIHTDRVTVVFVAWFRNQRSRLVALRHEVVVGNLIPITMLHTLYNRPLAGLCPAHKRPHRSSNTHCSRLVY